MAYTPEILTSAIIALGDFNPAIFSPDWLERNGLIGKDDADSAREGDQGRSMIISRQVATFTTGWFTIQVLENQFSLTSEGAFSPAFKDLAVGILQLVPHTPVTAVGLNFIGHFKLANEIDYHRVGDVLAPKDIWKSLCPDDAPGLASLSVRIQRGTRDEPLETKDEKRITLQKSKKFKFGIYLAYNDHHDVSDVDDELRPAEHVAAIIDNQWEFAWQDALRLFDGVFSMALKK